MSVDPFKYAGRPYIDGIQDCFSLAQRFYQDTCGLEVRSYARPQHWHLVGRFDFFSQLFPREGFYDTGNSCHRVRVGDALLMAIGRTEVNNHVAIYVGQNKILHHLRDSISRVDPYNDRWRYRVRAVLRHPVVEQTLHTLELGVADKLPAQVKFRGGFGNAKS